MRAINAGNSDNYDICEARTTICIGDTYDICNSSSQNDKDYIKKLGIFN